MLKMRERLIELIKQGDKTFSDKYTGKVMSHIDELYDFIADYLLANGVIVPPVMEENKVYRIVDMSKTACRCFVTEETVEKYAVIYKNIVGAYSIIPFDEIGKTVFLTREEAEQALKGGAE